VKAQNTCACILAFHSRLISAFALVSLWLLCRFAFPVCEFMRIHNVLLRDISIETLSKRAKNHLPIKIKKGELS
jgi:hypothetical protein